MCMASAPKVKEPPPPPPPPPAAPTKASEPVKRARREQQTRQRNLGGDAANQLTGPRGLMAPAHIGNPTLVGG